MGLAGEVRGGGYTAVGEGKGVARETAGLNTCREGGGDRTFTQ